MFGFLFLMSSFEWLTVRAISISTGKGELLARMRNMVAEMAGFKLSSHMLPIICWCDWPNNIIDNRGRK